MPTETEQNKDPNRIRRTWIRISDDTGISFEMVHQIHFSITKKRECKITSKNASKFIILDLINNDNGHIEDILEHNGIKSSEDIGAVIKSLCKDGFLIKEKEDNYDDFKGQFKSETINQFIKSNNLKKDTNWYNTICYILFFIGFVLLIYSHNVRNKLEWVGGIILLIGWLVLTNRDKIKVEFNKVFKSN